MTYGSANGADLLAMILHCHDRLGLLIDELQASNRLGPAPCLARSPGHSLTSLDSLFCDKGKMALRK